MSLNQIIKKLKNWNNKKNKKDLEYSSNYEEAFYQKTSDVSNVLNEVTNGTHGNGVQY